MSCDCECPAVRFTAAPGWEVDFEPDFDLEEDTDDLDR